MNRADRRAGERLFRERAQMTSMKPSEWSSSLVARAGQMAARGDDPRALFYEIRAGLSENAERPEVALLMVLDAVETAGRLVAQLAAARGVDVGQIVLELAEQEGALS